jgi:D-alanyl-D-alanine carboxypeptidase
LGGILFVVAALLALAGPAAAAPSKLQRELDSLVAAKGGPPGVSVLISHGSRSEFLHAGVADLKGGRAPTKSEHVRIAGVSGAFSALMAVWLSEGTNDIHFKGRLHGMLPGVLPAGEKLTLVQLLQHTSGVPNYFESEGFLERLSAHPAAYVSPLELVGYVAEEPLEFQPGSRYRYSDTDDVLVGLAEEKAARLPYPKLLQNEVLGELHMSGTSLPRTVRMPAPFMHGYEVGGKKPKDVSELVNPASAWAAAGIVSTPADLAKLAPDYVVNTLRAAQKFSVPWIPGASSPPGPGKNSAGLGIYRYQLPCGTVYGHTGSFPGYRLLLAASRDGKRSVVFVVNSQIVPGQGSPEVVAAITRAQSSAICRALGQRKALARPQRVLVPASIDESTLSYRPHRFFLSGDGTFGMTGVKWQSYGGATASGTARAYTDNCTPNCAEGKLFRPAAKLRLTTIVECSGQPVYTRLRYRLRGALPKGFPRHGSVPLLPPAEGGAPSC